MLPAQELMRMRLTSFVLVAGGLVAGLLPSSPSVAQVADDGSAPASQAASVEKSAATGRFLSLTHPGAVAKKGAFGSAMAGYDSAGSSASFEATAEVGIWGPIALRGGAVYAGASKRLRPSIGARVQALTESAHGVDASVGVFYKPEGLTEPEGEIEAVFSAGRHLGSCYATANLAYGQDPEANERDGEVRLAFLAPVASHLILGIDGRARFDLGSSKAGEPKLDLLVGPVAAVPVGPIAFLLQGGASAVKFAATKAGAFVLAGAGSSF
jgi:hypothetical protein